MTKPVFGLKGRPRKYRCMACGHEENLSTNHTDKCFHKCENCGWRGSRLDGEYLRPGLRPFEYVGPPLTKEDYM